MYKKKFISFVLVFVFALAVIVKVYRQSLIYRFLTLAIAKK